MDVNLDVAHLSFFLRSERKALLGAIFGPSGASGSLWGPKRAPERVSESFLGGQRELRDRKKVARGGLKSEKEEIKRGLRAS